MPISDQTRAAASIVPTMCMKAAQTLMSPLRDCAAFERRIARESQHQNRGQQREESDCQSPALNPRLLPTADVPLIGRRGSRRFRMGGQRKGNDNAIRRRCSS